MKIYELIFDVEEKNNGLTAISVVNQPAIESNFIALSKDEKQKIVLSNEEKKIITGAALIPNKKIYRDDIEGEEAYVYFSEDTIKKLVEAYFKENKINSFTIEHKDKNYEITMYESWFVEDEKNDKSNLYNLNLKKGSWVISLKVHSDELWKEIKEGNLKGFSIEANLFTKMTAKFNKQKRTKNDILNDLINSINEIKN